MTKPKPTQFRAMTGRKPKRFKNNQDKLLKMLFDSCDLTPWQASLYARCGYEYALKKFLDFYGHMTLSEYRARVLFVKKWL